MGLLGDEYPKALLPVANEPLIGHHLKLLHSLGVREIYVVVGYRATDIVRALGDGERYHVTLHYVEQGASLGSAHALGQVRPFVRRPFLLVLGDYHFVVSHPEHLTRYLQGGKSAMLAKREPDRRLLAEACELQVDQEGRILKVVEKPAAPEGDLKGCGFYALQPEIFDSVARTPRTALRDEYELSISLEIYIDSGHPLFAEEGIVWDFNFTRPEDLLECNLKWLEQAGLNNLVAESARVEQGTRLEHTVVGNNVRITGSSNLKETVVFSQAEIAGDRSINRALVTPGGLYLLSEKLLASHT
jgi:glucose-1-phosphate thymidylyltransferase